MVRRLKEDLREVAGGFPEREVVQVDIDGLPADAPELRLSALLDEYRAAARASGFAATTQDARRPRRRSLVVRPPAAAPLLDRGLRPHPARSTGRRSSGSGRGAGGRPQPPTPSRRRQPRSTSSPAAVDADDDRAELAEEELERRGGRPGRGRHRGRRPVARDAARRASAPSEQQLLDEMTRDRRGRPRPARRPRAPARRLDPRRTCAPTCRRSAARQAGAPPPDWNDRRVLIFTEYDDTKRYLQRAARSGHRGTDRADERIAVFHGRHARRRARGDQARLQRRPGQAPAAHPDRHRRRPRGRSTSRRTAPTSSTSTCPGTRAAWSSATAASTASSSPSRRSAATTSSTASGPRTASSRSLVRKTETIKKELGSLSQVVDDGSSDLLKRGIRHDRGRGARPRDRASRPRRRAHAA